MATITRTPSGTWKAVVRKRGWPTTVKTFRLKRDAEDWARTTEDEMVQGVYIRRTEIARLTVDAALSRYLSEVSPGKRSEVSDVRSAKPLRAALGRYSLAALTPSIIRDYRDQRLATISERTGRTLSPNTVRLELALLGHLFTIAAKEWGLSLVYNPVRLIRRPAAPPGRTRRLTWREARSLLRECDRQSNPMLGWIVRVALYTGMRHGEIVTLRVDQVDLGRRIVRLSRTKNGSARTVPLSRRAARVLRQALAHPIRPQDTDLVFFGELGRDGKSRGPYTTNRAWAMALQRAGIKGLRFHDLRHEAISRFVERGLSDQEVAAISGHKSMQMLKRYTHLRAEDLVTRLG